VAGKRDRWTAVMGLAGSAAALLTLVRVDLGIAQEGDVALEADCRVNDARCRRDRDCCSNKCQVRGRRRRRRGKCVCAGQGANCQADRGCCSGVCRSGNCDCGDKGDLCNNDADCCSRRCENGACRCGRRKERCDNNRGCCSGSCAADGFCN
jgi:hypothetical protein